MQPMKRKIISMLLCILLMTMLLPFPAIASTEWPDGVSIESDAGIIMDAHSGAVLYGKNIHSTYAPASITKVLTALIVLEQCSPDEIVTFSHNAVHNVESNSTSAGYDTGDTASVKDCLYALLLKSANEAANALAEHISGTTEEFAVLMNEKAEELGCQDSHFSNPSGLNDKEHYVSAYDMALITRAAFENEDFSEIVATTYYELPPNKTNPEGQGISPGNKMVKKNWPDQYRPDVIGGKTGYTSIALNTLVIGAQQGDTKFVTVILHSSGTQYNDTKAMLNFGFANFKSVKIADYDKTFSTIGDDLKIAGLPTSEKQVLTIDPDSTILLPVTADFSETNVSLDYSLPADAPSGAVASVNYLLGERVVGRAYLTLKNTFSEAGLSLPKELLDVQPSALAPVPSDGSPDAELPDADGVPAGPSARSMPEADSPDSESGNSDDNKIKVSLKVPPLFWQITAAILIVGSSVSFSVFAFKRRKEREATELQERRRRRAERLRESGISEADFDLLMQKRRASSPEQEPKKHPQKKSRWKL